MSDTLSKETDKVMASSNGDERENKPGGGSGAHIEDYQPAIDPVPIDPAEQADPKKRNRRPFYIAGGVLLIAAIVGLVYWLYARQFEYTDDAFVDGEIVQISPKISAYVAKVYVRENQFVKKGDLLVELNSDGLTARLENAKSQLHEAQAQRQRSQAQTNLTRKVTSASGVQARSNVETARNNVVESGLLADAKRSEIRQLESAVKTARANRALAQAQIPQAESNLRLAKLEHDRSLSLYQSGSVSRQNLDISQNALERATAELNAARNQVTAADSRIDEAVARVATAQSNYRQSLSRINSTQSEVDESMGRLKDADAAPERIAVDQSQIGTADAGIEKAEASVREAELELSYTKIVAPEDGFVARKNVQEGQLVQPGAALMAISQTDVWIVANFKETQLERMRIGQAVDIKVDAFPGKTFRGRIESFQAGTGSAFSVLPPENASGNFVKVVQRVPVKILFDERPDDAHLLVPGMSVSSRVRVL